MKYVGVIYDEVIIAKAKIYVDVIADNQIELTEEQYNSIVTPCKLIDGTFVSWDFPDMGQPNVFEGGQIELVSYVGTGKAGASNPCSVTFNNIVPRVLVMLAAYEPEAYMSHNTTRSFVNACEGGVIILCDKLTTEYDQYMGFDIMASGSMSNKACAKKSEDGKTISWYIGDTTQDNVQANIAGWTYYILGIG